MDCTTEEIRFDSWRKQDLFLLFTTSRPALRPTQPAIQLVKEAVSLSVKWCEDDTPSSVEVNNGGAIPPLTIDLYLYITVSQVANVLIRFHLIPSEIRRNIYQ
jgi:hypothetical protein